MAEKQPILLKHGTQLKTMYDSYLSMFLPTTFLSIDQWFSNFYVIWETADTADVLVSPCDALMHVAYTFKVIWASLMLESHHFKLRTLSQCSAISSDGKWSWENPKLTQTPSSIPGDTAHSFKQL